MGTFTEPDPAERRALNRLFLLAINPFVLLSMTFAVAAFRQWFRFYSILTILIVVALAALAFSHVPAASADQPTSWLGLSERSSQYAHQLWHAVLAVVLLRARDRPRAALDDLRWADLSRGGQCRIRNAVRR